MSDVMKTCVVSLRSYSKFASAFFKHVIVHPTKPPNDASQHNFFPATTTVQLTKRVRIREI